jgi:hypothetical protein
MIINHKFYLVELSIDLVFVENQQHVHVDDVMQQSPFQ